MQVFERKTTDYIAQQLGAYFMRKKDRPKMSLRDAKALIDYVSGPAPGMPTDKMSNQIKTRVSGGGAIRPTEQRIERILQKYATDEKWDVVFDDLLKKCRKEPDAVKIIHYAFRDQKKESEICEKLFISPRTYYSYKKIILTRAAVMATAAGLLEA